MKTTRAVLFLNLGGPETLDDVKPFLFRLFEDPEIIRIRWSPVRKIVARLISNAREKEAQHMYTQIGGGSPIRQLTDQQASSVEQALKRGGHDTLVRTAFSCSPPLIEDVVKTLVSEGVTHFLAMPLYPQYSLTTTKSALDRTRAAVRKFSPKARLTEIRFWHTHPLFLKAHAELIQKEISKFSEPVDGKIHLLFSAHSIPEKLVTRLGDPYQKQMEETVRGVVDLVGWKGPWSLGWQSKLGPLKWLGPSTEETVHKLGREGATQVLVVPIAFVTDHIETLYELDQELAEVAKQVGIREFRRTPGLNNHPTFIEALVDLVLEPKVFWSEAVLSK